MSEKANTASGAVPVRQSDLKSESRLPRKTDALRKPKPWLWSLLWLAILAGFSGMGAAALLWLTSLPPLPDCQQATQLTVDMDRLYCAQEAARSGELPKLIAGVEMLKQWHPDHPLYAEAQRLTQEWSTQILAIAREKVKQSDLKGAMAAVSHIPKSSPAYKDAQAAIGRWKKLWQRGEAIETKAQAALKAQQWDLASDQVTVMTEMEQDYWRFQRAGELAQQIGVEKQAWQALSKARKLAEGGAPAQLSAAIAKAQEVPPTTYAGAAVKPNLKQWSHTLLTLATQKWQQGDTTGAAAMLQISAKVTPTPEIQDQILFGGAYALVSTINSRWLPAWQHVWNLMEATAAMQQVKPDSPFYAQAQTHEKNWQAQLQDTVQLQYASLAAGLGQRSTYGLAIAQSQQVAANRPRYGQAQTLAAYWTGEIERIEDRPYLSIAQALAQSGQIPDLQKAIAEASKIGLGRALRRQAQGAISAWQDQIEKIEDQPFLDQAWALAKQGKLNEAITEAGNIDPERALYAEAQSNIASWRAEQIRQAQIAADQPILDQATALADSGNLSAAINVATQIDPGRALYDEAQTAIAHWKSQRDAILNPPTPEATDSPTPQDGSAPALPNLEFFPGKGLPQPTPFNPEFGLPPKLDLAPPSPDPATAPPVRVPDPEPLSTHANPSPTNAPADGYTPAPSRPAYGGYYNDRSNQNPH